YLKVSGSSKITDNHILRDEETCDNNVYFFSDDDCVQIIGKLTEGASIGVNKEKLCTFTKGWSEYMDDQDPLDYFMSDDGYIVVREEDELTFVTNITELQDLIDHAEDGATIKLEKDYTAGSKDSNLILFTRTLTLDLNGHAIDYSKSKSNDVILCCNSTHLTIKDSSKDEDHPYGSGRIIGYKAEYSCCINIYNKKTERNSFSLEGGTITGAGRGVYVNQCDFEMSGGRICNNTAYGVEVSNDSSMTLSGGMICQNADKGVYFSSPYQFTMSGGKICDNSDGGVSVGNFGKFIMTGGSITGNGGDYGGIYLNSGCEFTMTGGSVTDNYVSGKDAAGVIGYGDISVSGLVNITGNINGYNQECNVKVSDRKGISVIGKLDPDARIGLSYIEEAVSSLGGSNQGDKKDFPKKVKITNFSENADWENFIEDEASTCRLVYYDGELIWTGKIDPEMVYKITFTDEGNTYSTQYVPTTKVEENAEVQVDAAKIRAYEPRPITKDEESSVFLGWQKDGVDYDFSTPVTGDLTLTAKWEKKIEVPAAASGLIYDGSEQTGVAEGTGYTVSGNSATNAGNYTAKATLKKGYVWKDGTYNVKDIAWSIAKASAVPGAPSVSMNDVEYLTKTVGEVKLPENWQWIEEDASKELPVGQAFTASATYTGEDRDNFEEACRTVRIQITRNACKHPHVEEIPEEVPSCIEKGKTEGQKCSDCGKILVEPKEKEALDHDWGEWTVTKNPTETEEGEEVRVCKRNKDHKETRKIAKLTAKPVTEEKPGGSVEDPEGGKETTQNPVPAKENTVLTSQEEKAEFVVTSKEGEAPTVSYKAPTDPKAKVIEVPSSVTIDGVTYSVTVIDENAFRGNKTVEKIVIPATVKKLTAKMFKGCKKLKYIIIKSLKLTAKNVKANAFKGVSKKTVIKVPKKKLKAYRKLFYKKGLNRKVKIKK
ncbi:MAG: leucine-rich repeat protein, partial [Lachnospiraceae bacterium]|nr:leucine-rich repeat protein [Lachnospiraceae bacterium]